MRRPVTSGLLSYAVSGRSVRALAGFGFRRQFRDRTGRLSCTGFVLRMSNVMRKSVLPFSIRAMATCRFFPLMLLMSPSARWQQARVSLSCQRSGRSQLAPKSCTKGLRCVQTTVRCLLKLSCLVEECSFSEYDATVFAVRSGTVSYGLICSALYFFKAFEGSCTDGKERLEDFWNGNEKDLVTKFANLSRGLYALRSAVQNFLLATGVRCMRAICHEWQSVVLSAQLVNYLGHVTWIAPKLRIASLCTRLGGRGRWLPVGESRVEP